MGLRTIIYRIKNTGGGEPGPIQRAVVDDAALPATISGLTFGVVYERDLGRGVWADFTPLSPAAAWDLDEDFNSLGNGAPITDLGNWTRSNVNGGTGLFNIGTTGSLNPDTLTSFSSFAGAEYRWETDIGADQEVEVDLVLPGGTVSAGEVRVGLNNSPSSGSRYAVLINPAGTFRIRKGTTWNAALLGDAFEAGALTLPATYRFVSRASGGNRIIELFSGLTLLNTWTDSSSPLNDVRVAIGAYRDNHGGVNNIAPTAIRARAL